MKSFADEDPQLAGVHWVQDAGACSGVYVLEDGLTLIDAGNMYGLIDELQDLGSLDRLQRILVTHCHFDHVGGMEEIFQVVSPDVYVHPVTREYLRLLRAPFPEFFDALEKDGKLRLIQDGETIPGGRPMKVLHTPGHTAGDLCFFDNQSGALFCGDAVLPYRFKLGPALSRPDEVCGGRMKDKLQSLKRLLGLPVRHLFSGHGEPVLHKGGGQIKLSLYGLYQSLHEDRPELAWAAMGHDLVELGQLDEARQCWAKASQLACEAPEVKRLRDALEGSEGEAAH
jgi:glyoxylase-like metal-dependent hydrolase (beta-lactamase superfamily II)